MASLRAFCEVRPNVSAPVAFVIDFAALWVILALFLVSGDTPPHRGKRLADHDANKTAGSDKRKQSLYFPEAMLQEIKDEAARLDRSLSWVVQRAWKMARLEIKKIPSVNDISDDEEETAG
jgi:uncharacterized small protein (TIGR04563 family)